MILFGMNQRNTVNADPLTQFCPSNMFLFEDPFDISPKSFCVVHVIKITRGLYKINPLLILNNVID